MDGPNIFYRSLLRIILLIALSTLAAIVTLIAVLAIAADLQGPPGGLPLRPLGDCTTGARAGAGYNDRLAIWRTGDHRYAVRQRAEGPVNHVCYRFDVPAGDALLELRSGERDTALLATIVLRDTNHVERLEAVSLPPLRADAPIPTDLTFVALSSKQGGTIEISATPKSPARAEWITLASVRLLDRPAGSGPPGSALHVISAEQAIDLLLPVSTWSRYRLTAWLDPARHTFAHLLLIPVFLLISILAAVLLLRSRTRVAAWIVALAFGALALANTAFGLGLRAVREGLDVLTEVVVVSINTSVYSYAVDAAQNIFSGHAISALTAAQRMPGYVGLGALSALGAAKDNYVSIYTAAIASHAALAFVAFVPLVYVLVRSFWLAGLTTAAMLATIAHPLIYVQVDTIVLMAWYLAAALLIHATADGKDDAVSTSLQLGIHAAFAILVLLRGEFLLLWLFTAVLLPRKWISAASLAVGLAFIAICQGFFQQAAGLGFSPRIGTITNGHVAFVGLWQNTFNPFIWQPTDESFAEWMQQNGYGYDTPEGERFAVPEIFRFYLTAPAYVVLTVLQKFYGYWSGVGRGVVQVYTAFGRPFGVATNIMARVLFVAILVAIAIGFHRRRTLLLASPALISLPLFSLIAGSPRYMIYVTASIFIAGLPLIIDRRFFIAIRARRRIAAVIGAVVLVFFAGFPLIRYYIVEKHPDFLLWAPIDPAQSTLYRLR
jgi:hypothetical protein